MEKNQNRNFTAFIGVITLLLVWIMAARTPIDSDMWWHLRAGEETWKQHAPYTIDTLSFTREGIKWVSHSWLFEAILYGSYAAFGFQGICALVALSAVLTMGILFIQMKEPPLLRAFLIILASSIAATIWSARPQAVSLVLLALTLLIIDKAKKNNQNLLYLLLPIFLLWANLYGGYSLGLMVLGITAVGEGLNYILRYRKFINFPWKRILFFALIGLLSCLIILINPHGYMIWTIPFETVNIHTIHLIDEWQAPDFTDPNQMLFLVLAILLILSFLMNLRNVDPTDFLLSAWFIAMSLYVKKYFGPAAVVLTPILGNNLWQVFGRIKIPLLNQHPQSPRTTNTQIYPMSKKVINLTIVALLGMIAIVKFYYVSYPVIVEAYIDQQYPQGAIEWIKKNLPTGNMFNEYEWGGYLTWELREYPVYIDARTDLYGDEIITEWLSILSAEDGWQKKLKARGVNFIMVRKERKLAINAIEENWLKVYEDNLSLILINQNIKTGKERK